MKKLTKFFCLIATLTVLSFGTQAKEAVPIVEHQDIPVTTASGKPISADQVRDAITAAAIARKWEVSRSPSQNLLSASFSWYGKHSIAVSIPYSAEKFSIKYQNSINMKYGLANLAPDSSTDLSRIGSSTPGIPPGTPMIHPRYNEFVQQLLQSIQAELKKL